MSPICQQDIRALNIITAVEKEFTTKLLKDPEKISPEGQSYHMRQGASERVSDFAHRFIDVQTELVKLIPNIHYTSDGRDLEI